MAGKGKERPKQWTASLTKSAMYYIKKTYFAKELYYNVSHFPYFLPACRVGIRVVLLQRDDPPFSIAYGCTKGVVFATKPLC